MKKLSVLFIALSAWAQTNVLILTDRQTPASSHAWYLTGAATMSADHTMTFSDFGILVPNVVEAQGGFLSAANSWQGVNSNTDGALLRGYGVSEVAGTQSGTATASSLTIVCTTNCPFPSGMVGTVVIFNGGPYLITSETTGGGAIGVLTAPPSGTTYPYQIGITTGGYLDLAPIDYTPSPGYVCYDVYGNLVSQPSPLNGLSGFGSNDSLLWVGSSPMQGYRSGTWTIVGSTNYYQTGTACAAPLVPPSGAPYGLNSNSYFFTNSGFASGNTAFDTLQIFTGGAQAGSFVASSAYPPGTQVRSGASLPSGVTVESSTGVSRISNEYGAYLGGYIMTGFADQWPGGSSGTCTSIASCDSPLASPGPLIPGLSSMTGTMAFNTALGCEGVNNGSSWNCLLTSAMWTLSTSTPPNLYPTSSTARLLVGEATDFSGAALEVNGSISTQGGSSLIQSTATGTNIAFQVSNGSTPFVVYGNGELAASSIVDVGVTTAGCAQFTLNGSGQGVLSSTGVACGSGSGSTGVTSVTGTANEIIVSASTGAVTFSTPQAIGTSSSPAFSVVNLTSGLQISSSTVINSSSQFVGAAVNVTGVVESQVTGCGSGNPSFQTSNTDFSVDGCGNVSGVGTSNFTGGYQVNGTNSINSSNQFIGSAVNVTGAVQSQVTGSGSSHISFQTSNNDWSVDGAGNMSMVGNLNNVGGAYQISGTTVIDSSQNATFASLKDTGVTVAGCAQFSSSGVLSSTTVACGTGGGGANANGYYWVSQSSNAPANAVNIGSLSSGLLKITVSGGVATPATAVAGTDYVTSVAGTTNEVLVSGTGTLTLSTPQAIGTSSNVQFGSANLGYLEISGSNSINSSNQFVGAAVNVSGIVESQVSGSGYAFQVANGLGTPFIVDGLGDVSAYGNYNATGSSSSYKMGGLTVIDHSGNLYDLAVSSSGCAQFSSSGELSSTGVACGTGSGGVVSLNSYTGGLTIAGTTNEIVVTPSGGTTLTISTPQAINTTSSPTFAGLTLTGLSGCLQASSGAIASTGSPCGSGSSYWTLASPVLYPSSTSYNLLIGETSEVDVGPPAAKLEVAGTVSISGTYQSTMSGAGSSYLAFKTANNDWSVDGAGDQSMVGVLNITSSGGLTLGFASGCLQVGTGGVVTGTGSTCGSGSGSSYWTLNSGNLYPNSTAYTVLVGESTPLTSSKLEVANNQNSFAGLFINNTNTGTGSQTGVQLANSSYTGSFGYTGTAYSGFGSMGANTLYMLNGGGAGNIALIAYGGAIQFMSGGNTEVARFNSSGQLVLDALSNGCLQISSNIVSSTGSACGSGGGSGVTSLTGTAHEIIVLPGSTGNLTLSTPQPIDITSSPSFTGLTLGNLNLFGFSNGCLQVTGYSVSSTGTGCGSGGSSYWTLNTSGSVPLLSPNSTSDEVAIGYSGASLGYALYVVGTSWFNSASSFYGGITTYNNSSITIGSGNFYDRATGGASTSVSCSGVADGWMAVTSDGYVAVCLGSTRYRAALTSY